MPTTIVLVHGAFAVRIVRPPDAEGTLPVILYMHGGGWVLGNADTHDRLIRELAVGTGAAVALPGQPSAEAAESGHGILRFTPSNPIGLLDASARGSPTRRSAAYTSPLSGGGQ